MRRNFARLDDSLIERVFQPLADTLAERLGMDRLAAACLCVDIASVGCIVSQARSLLAGLMAWDASQAILRLTLLLVGLAALTSLRTLFRRVGAGGKAKNPLRISMQPHRAVVLLMLLSRLAGIGDAGFAGFADGAMLTFAAAALYLGACAARPPRRRRGLSLAGGTGGPPVPAVPPA